MFSILVLLFMLINTSYAQLQRFSINDDSVLSEKSAVSPDVFDLAIKKARRFVINPSIVYKGNVSVGDTIQLDLFSDKNYSSVVKSVTTDINGTTAIVARLTGFQYAYCYISVSGEKVLLSVDIPEKNEKYTTRLKNGSKSLYLLQLDENKLDILEEGEMPTIEQTKEDSIRSGNTLNSKSFKIKSEADTARVDVLILYTPAAKEWASIYQGSIDNTINMAMTYCNLVSENSKLGATFNLVYSSEVNYTETGNSENDLTYLTDGTIPNVSTIRDASGADLVVLLSKTNDVGGISWLLNYKSGLEDYGYSLIRVQQASGYSTIHEIGHNMGAHHHKEQTTQPGPTKWSDWAENTWSAGWRWTGDNNGKYCSVMTYSRGSYFLDGITHMTVPYFSSPDISYQGQSTGDAVDGDNTRTLKVTKHVVAAYSDEMTQQNTPTVYTLSVYKQNNEAFSGGGVVDEGESGVTAKGIVWSTKKMPTLSDSYTVDGAGAGSFTSQLSRLIVDSVYYVRAYATNSYGTSYGIRKLFIITERNKEILLPVGKFRKDKRRFSLS